MYAILAILEGDNRVNVADLTVALKNKYTFLVLDTKDGIVDTLTESQLVYILADRGISIKPVVGGDYTYKNYIVRSLIFNKYIGTHVGDAGDFILYVKGFDTEVLSLGGNRNVFYTSNMDYCLDSVPILRLNTVQPYEITGGIRYCFRLQNFVVASVRLSCAVGILKCVILFNLGGELLGILQIVNTLGNNAFVNNYEADRTLCSKFQMMYLGNKNVGVMGCLF